MKGRRLATIAVIAVAVGSVETRAQAPLAQNTSFRTSEGERVLQHRVVVAATPTQVYAAFTTADGIRAWAVPTAAVDFRMGGIWESNYSLSAKIGADGNIKNRYVAFVPNKMVAFQAIAAPKNFPYHDVLREIVTVVDIDSIGPTQTSVTISMVGYRSGEAYDVLYKHFEAGNQWSIEKLRERFVSGPLDWQKLLSGKD